MSIPSAVYIDGTIYSTLALMGFLMSRFGSDEAAKYIAPQTLWWLLTVLGAINAIALALKLYRSTAFADHQREVKETSSWKKAEDQKS